MNIKFEHIKVVHIWTVSLKTVVSFNKFSSYQTIIKTQSAVIATFLAAAREQGELTALDDLNTVEAILNTIFGICMSWIMSRRDNLSGYGVEYIRVLLRGLQAT